MGKTFPETAGPSFLLALQRVLDLVCWVFCCFLFLLSGNIS